jgi:hypothetical protein
MLKRLLLAVYYSFPVQLLMMHLKKYQLLLSFWFLLAATISGGIMPNFGAATIFLAPEYLGKVHFLSGFFTGIALGVFMMSWNITSFLLISHHFRFLAASSQPFRNYTLNNLGLPLIFILFYLIHLLHFELNNELMQYSEVGVLVAGLFSGMVMLILFAFAYMAVSEKAIRRTLDPEKRNVRPFFNTFRDQPSDSDLIKQIRVDSYFTGFFKIRQPRNVTHYNRRFLERVFKRHHFAAVIAIVIAFLSLMTYGFFLDLRLLQLPAAAGLFVFFSILIAATGAFVFWLKNWSIPVLVCILFFLNWLIRSEILDIRNKAFGLDYNHLSKRPAYTDETLLALSSREAIREDSLKMIKILERWKQQQGSEKPYLYLLNVSGGGTRSATFSYHTMRAVDSAMNGRLMKKVFLFTGASGGMLGATFYRELYRQSKKDSSIKIADPKYGEQIAGDLLNPIFSAIVTRELVTPAQHFTVGPYRYVKERGYAFEEQLNRNTNFILGHRLKDYQLEEKEARIPIGLFYSTVTEDSRKLMICTQPVRFLMRPVPDSSNGLFAEPDAIDYAAFFSRQNPYNLRLLTALRMNATFPYILPNVWLPSKPVIDVMDAGMRDNFGLELSLRFISVFEHWIKANTSGVLLLQIRDSKRGVGKETEFERPGLGDIFYKPFSNLQYNFLMVQDYFLESMLGNLQKNIPVRRFAFLYEPAPNRINASLNFHLTAQEKKDVIESVQNTSNRSTLEWLMQTDRFETRQLP